MSKVKVEMPETAVEQNDKATSIPYDELMRIANSLSASNAELQKRLNDVMLGNFFTRLEFLFKVVKFSDKFTDDFVKQCIEEIQENMTIRDEEKED